MASPQAAEKRHPPTPPPGAPPPPPRGGTPPRALPPRGPIANHLPTQPQLPPTRKRAHMGRATAQNQKRITTPADYVLGQPSPLCPPDATRAHPSEPDKTSRQSHPLLPPRNSPPSTYRAPLRRLANAELLRLADATGTPSAKTLPRQRLPQPFLGCPAPTPHPRSRARDRVQLIANAASGMAPRPKP